MKNKQQRAAGRTGGQRRTPALTEARLENLRRAHEARPVPTGGASERWAVKLPIPVKDRASYVDAAQAAGQSVGEWVAEAMREKIGAGEETT